MRVPLNPCTKSISAIRSAKGASFLFGRFARVRLGGSSSRIAARTVVRDTPSFLAIVRDPTPCACR